jgi:hypothetical protein
MDNDTLLWVALVIVAFVVGIYLIFWFKERKDNGSAQPAGQDTNILHLKLQAYERMVLLSERISLPSLLSRIPAGDMNVRQFQVMLTQQIRNEFEHNITQQIYVTSEAWQAVSNLKEQNIYIINNLASGLSADAKGSELARMMMELLNTDPKVSLHPVVLEALNHEAKRLM